MNKVIFILLGLLSLSACALDYNFESTYSIPIKMSILKEISTKDKPLEGSELKFEVLEDVYYKEKLVVKSGEIAKARVATVMTSGMNGFPAEIFVEDFEIKGIKQSQLKDVYIKAGMNRCLIVYPIKWALTPIPFVGSLTNFIKGGHSRIKATDVVTIEYYPEWN